jgi:hypothetical protein
VRALKRAQRPPGSHARNHDLSAHDLHRAADQVTCPNAIQAIVYIAGLCGQVALTLENDALAVLELGHALAKASPSRCAFDGHFLGAGPSGLGRPSLAPVPDRNHARPS